MRDPKMGEKRAAVLAYVHAHPGATDELVHEGVSWTARLPESTVKHLLRLRDAGLVRSEVDEYGSTRYWFPCGAPDA